MPGAARASAPGSASIEVLRTDGRALRTRERIACDINSAANEAEFLSAAAALHNSPLDYWCSPDAVQSAAVDGPAAEFLSRGESPATHGGSATRRAP